jgi:uncharacterized membrane protein
MAIPIAFGELRDSVHVDATSDKRISVIANAPHAAAVEMGSRPHVVPLGALIAWVKLRGMQGLDKSGNVRVKKGPGSTTAQHSYAVASQIAAMSSGGATDIGAPVAIAKAIQMKIAKSGTRPQFYMRGTMATAWIALNECVKDALRE